MTNDAFKLEKLIPLPTGMTVMVPVTYYEEGTEEAEDDKKYRTIYVDARDTTDAYCIAVGTKGGEEVCYPLNLSNDGDCSVEGKLEDEAVIVNLPKCPSCGHYMKPHLRGNLGVMNTVYTCDCGRCTGCYLGITNAEAQEREFWSYYRK